MTTNQIVVLLDIYRGFQADRHPATLESDLFFLRKVRWIEEVPSQGHEIIKWKWRLTSQGHEIIKWLKKSFELMGG
jgi:hypothetical protein